jgi:hypothetical protein
LFGKAPCHLTKERVDALNELGFDWVGTADDNDANAAEDKNDTISQGDKDEEQQQQKAEKEVAAV